MPAPAVYVLAVVGAVGAAFAFKEFVYEPVIAPRVERWAAEYLAKRAARRRRLAEPVASAPLRTHRRRRSDSVSSDTDTSDGDEGHDNPKGKGVKPGDSIEMNELEVHEWRKNVHRSRTASGSNNNNMRQRKPFPKKLPLEEPTQELPYTPLSPSLVHVIMDPNDSSPPTTASYSTFPSRVSTPPAAARVSSLRSRTPSGSPVSSAARSTTLERTPSPRAAAQQTLSSMQAAGSPCPSSQPPLSDLTGLGLTYPTTEHPLPSVASLPSFSSSATEHPSNPFHPSPETQTQTYPYTHPIPSLSQIYPQELEAERGVEFVSPPSSRSESPFVEVERSASAAPSLLGSPVHVSECGFALSGRDGASLGRGSPLGRDGEGRSFSPRIRSSLATYQSFSSPSSTSSLSPFGEGEEEERMESTLRAENPWVAASPSLSSVSALDGATTPRSVVGSIGLSEEEEEVYFRSLSLSSEERGPSTSTLRSQQGPQGQSQSQLLFPNQLPPHEEEGGSEGGQGGIIQPPIDYPRSPSSSSVSAFSDVDYLDDLEGSSVSGRSDESWAV
ncbi:hypothetical protein BDQ17DRAFT_1541476 [Cyathus striatus]|nr:hypothetical protein BDQ17DRAFT_1541476 [Cyathus striatus]